ncbi:hypothetical protein [Crocosphaera chwakensis]|uniref:NurA domain-containing protein n=1 Tax=Crocosphaera chwakensis CCY0110 TaxID=391612 RepID=A3IZU5_9CHRO|nr:hypothetical protein [Crocosphaera chwakensis]EAZ87999.1 hypothetical protein CY0110_28979 [Crocosphaera chwakensis CCY0110]
MSKLSSIFKGFESSLRVGQKRNEELYHQHLEVVQELYNLQLKDLIKSWQSDFTSPMELIELRDQIRDCFGRDDIHFVAIDGTCKAEETTQFLLFYAGAYGARGSLELKNDPPILRYHKWSLEQDVSIVAQVPIPHAELEDILPDDHDPFAVSDFEKVNLSGLHTLLMQLSEVYLAYDTVASSRTDSPDLVLLDQSISSSMASNMLQPKAVRMVGSPWGSRHLTEADVIIALAHPFNRDLDIPTLKKFRQYTGILAKLEQNGGEIDLIKVAEEEGLKIEDFRKGISDLTTKGLAKLTNNNQTLVWIGSEPIDKSWSYTQSIFKEICAKLFVEKDPTALTYIVEKDEVRKQHWMSPPDLKFLIGVGLRMLIEECWKRNVLLVGLVKDSSSSYFTRNYLGVMRFLDVFPNLKDFSRPLPSTDRIALELVPAINDKLESPWSTVEFDGLYMTMFVRKDEKGESHLSGVRGDILAPERLTARSLGQFYLKHTPSNLLSGHVIFIERLLYPQWDKKARLKNPIETPLFGQVYPYFRSDINDINLGQTIVMYLLTELTRNHFAEVIGYPDPLHKADWGAKTVGRKLAEMLTSVDYVMRCNPLSRTLRSIRDNVKR